MRRLFFPPQLIYACATLKHWGNAVDSHGALGFAGVLLVTVAVASGLGFCSFVNIKFNAASTQVSQMLQLDVGIKYREQTLLVGWFENQLG